jgi:SAM-dependent methyltransferase
MKFVWNASMHSLEEWRNAYLKGWHRKCWSHQFPSPELAGFVASGVLRPDADVLEVGCGAGLDAVFLARLGHRVTGLDISAPGIDIARAVADRHSVTVSWVVGDVLDMPIEDEGFDLVSDRGCFHHLTDAVRATYFRSLGRVLRPGGLVFLRGCARRQAPFNPVSADAIEAHLDKDMFALKSITPMRLVTDAGGIDAVAALLRRL